MNIRKEADVQASGQVSEEDLLLINRLTRRELKAEEVYTFAVRLCDNDIDRDGEKFARETLEELGSLFVGVSGFGSVLLIGVSALLGIFCVAAGLNGFMFRHIPVVLRLVLVAGGLCMMIPGLATDLIGLAVLVLVALFQFFTAKKQTTAAA